MFTKSKKVAWAREICGDQMEKSTPEISRKSAFLRTPGNERVFWEVGRKYFRKTSESFWKNIFAQKSNTLALYFQNRVPEILEEKWKDWFLGSFLQGVT